MNYKSSNNRILINATHEEEVRIALVSDKFLENIFIEGPGGHNGNIYKAKVNRVVPSLQAAFVNFGSERHGFLPLKEISPVYFRRPVGENEQYSIADLISEGQEVLVQVEKEERGNKGAALTTFITLAGCYLVLMPNNPRAGGISRRIEGDDRESIKSLMNALSFPQEMGLIIRTAGVGKAIEELQWDLDILLNLWNAIKTASDTQSAPCLIHQESDIVIRAFRDYLRKDIGEIIIDNAELFDKAKMHLAKIRPEIVDCVKLYQDKSIPLFSRYHIENQIETAFQRDVRLPSGGYIVIQETEALVSVDVNSAKDTRGEDIEQTAFNTNREAAVEIARQLRLRDLGGLIVIDFIDMMANDHQRQIVEIFSNEIVHDKARVQHNGRISRFGLLEVSRQRLRPSLREASQIVCPRCSGLGSIRSTESLALHIMRLIRHEAMNENVAEIIVQAPIDVATFLLNEKRHVIDEIQQHNRILIRVLPNPHLLTPDYKLEKIYNMQANQLGHPSYAHKEEVTFEVPERRTAQAANIAEPIVKTVETPAKPVVAAPKKVGLIGRLVAALKTKVETKPEKPSEQQRNPRRDRYDRNDRSQQRRGNQRRGQNPRHAQGQSSHGQNNNSRSAQSQSQSQSPAQSSQQQGNRRRNNGPSQNRRQNHQGQGQGSRSRENTSRDDQRPLEAPPVAPTITPVVPTVNNEKPIDIIVSKAPASPARHQTNNARQVKISIESPTTTPMDKPAAAPVVTPVAAKPAPVVNPPVAPTHAKTEAQETIAPKPVQVKPTAPILQPKESYAVPPMETQPLTRARPGDKARKYHQQKAKERARNPLKYKLIEKKKAEQGKTTAATVVIETQESNT